MNFKIEVTAYFKKQAKYLIKKYPSLKQELSLLFESILKDPTQGISIGHHCFKIRLGISSKGKVNLEAQELLYKYILFNQKFIFFPSMTNPNRNL